MILFYDGHGLRARGIGIKDEETILEEHYKQCEKYNLFSTVGWLENKADSKNNYDASDNNRFPPTTMDLLSKRISDTFRVPPGFDRYNHLKYNKEAEYFFKMTIAHTESRLLYELDSKKIEELKKDLSEKYPWYYKFLHIADKLYYSKQNEAK